MMRGVLKCLKICTKGKMSIVHSLNIFFFFRMVMEILVNIFFTTTSDKGVEDRLPFVE